MRRWSSGVKESGGNRGGNRGDKTGYVLRGSEHQKKLMAAIKEWRGVVGWLLFTFLDK